jgi:hypothetical protein
VILKQTIECRCVARDQGALRGFPNFFRRHFLKLHHGSTIMSS